MAVKLYDRLRANASMAELLKHLNAVLDEEGDDRNREKRYDASDLYPGAVLVGWQVTPEEQLAFGFGHGRRIVAIGVIDTDGYDTYAVDEDFAVELATRYAIEHRLLRRPVPPTYVATLFADDLPDWLDPDDVRAAFEDVASEMANEHAAQANSYMDDQTAIDLEQYGYDDQSAFQIATFGDAVAVNGEALMSPAFARELGVKGERANVVFWAEGMHAFYRWLSENGYREVGELGGAWPGGDEGELQLDHVAAQVAEVLGAPEPAVEDILRSQNDEKDQIYWSSSSGEIEVYAVPRDEDED